MPSSFGKCAHIYYGPKEYGWSVEKCVFCGKTKPARRTVPNRAKLTKTAGAKRDSGN